MRALLCFTLLQPDYRGEGLTYHRELGKTEGFQPLKLLPELEDMGLVGGGGDGLVSGGGG